MNHIFYYDVKIKHPTLALEKRELERQIGLPIGTTPTEVSGPVPGQIIQTADGANKFSKTCFLKPNGAENFFK